MLICGELSEGEADAFRLRAWQLLRESLLVTMTPAHFHRLTQRPAPFHFDPSPNARHLAQMRDQRTQRQQTSTSTSKPTPALEKGSARDVTSYRALIKRGNSCLP
jgi:hypothetical protein